MTVIPEAETLVPPPETRPARPAPGTRCRRTPAAEENSVMIRPQPERLRMNRRKTVSVTPAIGARTVAGAISTVPRRNLAGTGESPVRSLSFAGLSQYLRTSVF